MDEPAQTLFDECVFQFENQLIKYIEPAKCRRAPEVMAGKSDRKLRIEANNPSAKENKST